MTAQQLKNSIFQMAVQGKLVPQDPADEPASVLLERIRAEKEQMVKEGKIKKEKNPSIIFRGDDNLPYERVGNSEPVCIADEVPFEIPDSWEWVRHNEIFDISGGSQPAKSKFSSIEKPGYVRLYQIRDYGKNPVPTYVPKDKVSKFTKEGDILLARYGASLGKVFIAREGAFNVAMAKVIPLFFSSNINKKYLFYYYHSELYQKVIRNHSRSAQAGFNKEDLAALFFPIPPIREQQRIVDKIESLIPFVDEYGVKYEALEKYNSGFSDQLKKSILQQAVQGKLVPQDPTDEPASVLLERIRTEKEQLIKDGKIKRDKYESAIYRKDDSYYEKVDGVERCIDDEIPFGIPENWEWVRFSQVLDVRDGTHDSPQYVDKGIPLVTSKNLVNGEIDFTTAKLISQQDAEKINSRSEVNNGDILFAMIGTIGNPVLIKKEREFCIKNMALFKPVSAEFLNMEFLFLFLQHEQFSMRKQASGGVQSFVSLTYLRNYFFPLPPYCEQEQIVNQVNLLIKTCDNLLLK